MAVFAFVLNSLPDRVKVYPTENYYYFSFTYAGVPYAGNIRFDASNRDQGKVNFDYFEKATPWRPDTPGQHKVLDASDGVLLTKLEPLVYRLSYQGKSVVFELNDLSQVKPPPGILAERESYVGPVFDDSGIRFFLVFNAAIKNFFYILDETVKVADQLYPIGSGGRVLIGKRTGFAYYRDRRRARKILIGVYAQNVALNNYFDGPFDQLPDNFVVGDVLRRDILAIQPGLKGKMDRFGGSSDGAYRYSIAPYLEYSDPRQLAVFDRCAARKHRTEAAYYRCFIAHGRRPALHDFPTPAATVPPRHSAHH